VAVATAAVVLLAASSAHALDFAVDTTKDGVDANPGDMVCAAQDGTCTLRAAIQEANETIATDVVELRAKTYELTRRRAASESSAEGELNITNAAIIDGRGAGRTVIRQTVADRVLRTTVGSLTGAQLRELTVTGGRVTRPGNQLGGGIYNEGVLILEDAAIRGNELVPDPAANSFGGGIHHQGGILIVSSSVVRGNLVHVETATGGGLGGGIMSAGGSLIVSDSKVVANTARQTGGPAGAGSGGGIATRGATQITRSTLARNTAEAGGALYVDGIGGELTLEESAVLANRARRGGGLLASSDHDMTVTNSTFSANRITSEADEAGGAAIWADLGRVALLHATLARNRPNPGQATLEATGTVGLTDVEIRGSVLDNPRRECLAPTGFITTNELNVYGDANCLPGGLTSNLVADPKLAKLASNPGPSPGPVTRTHALRPGSPALDLVTSGCPPPATDQRGLGRPQLPACDAGAYERGAG
jgi:CSLREA domain-containing protein